MTITPMIPTPPPLPISISRSLTARAVGLLPAALGALRSEA